MASPAGNEPTARADLEEEADENEVCFVFTLVFLFRKAVP